MSLTIMIGLIAGFCTTVAYLPQVLRTWRTRSTGDISLGMFSVMVLGLACWLIYGILLADIPLIVSNAVTLVLAGAILLFQIASRVSKRAARANPVA